MKKEICLLFLFIIPAYLYSQDTLKHKFKPEFYKYPSNADVEKSTKSSLAKIRNLSEQDIINNIGNPYSFLDSAQYVDIVCKEFFEFKLRFCRINEECITAINSNKGKISFHMRLLLNEAKPGDIINFYDIRCKTKDGSHHPYSGINFLVIE